MPEPTRGNWRSTWRPCRADTLHLVGHSLGGLVILKLFEENAVAAARLPPGRIVLLGSPLAGQPHGAEFRAAALRPENHGCGSRPRIAGAARAPMEPLRATWGSSWAIWDSAWAAWSGTLGGPSDGTVLVEETQLPGAADRVVLRVSHTGMLFSGAVAKQTAAFLRTGRFEK